jgi:hypothetical protein
MLMAMATKQGFEVTFSDNPADLSAANLEQYELLFGLNPTGTSLESRANERAAVEEWMTMKNGAFAGVHSSTDFMPNWAFWKEVTGQYYDKHDDCCSSQNIQWEPLRPTSSPLPIFRARGRGAKSGTSSNRGTSGRRSPDSRS